MNITQFPAVQSILFFSSAFRPVAAGGGLLGAYCYEWYQTGLFSSEAGEGSVPNAAATAAVNHPLWNQGLVQAFGRIP